MNRPATDAARGSALIITMCIIIALLIFSAGFMLSPWHDSFLTHRVYRGAVAFNLAEAGVEYVYHAMNADAELSDWGGAPKTRSVTGFSTNAGEVKGDFVIRAWPTPMSPKPYWLVESIGYAPGIHAPGVLARTVKALCVPKVIRPFDGAFLGDALVTLGGGLVVDSYDSRDGVYGGDNVHRGAPGEPDEGKGDIATNSGGDPAVDLGQNITVYGNVMTGEGGTVTGGATISGTVTHDFEQELPYNSPPSRNYVVEPGAGVLTVKSDLTYEPGYYKFTGIKSTGHVLSFTGPPSDSSDPATVVWVTGYRGTSISLSGNGTINLVGKVEFYLDAPASFSGNGLTNPGGIPADCSIYGGVGCTDLYIGGSAAFYGAVYAPNADLKFTGSEDKYGSFVGKTVTVQGGTEYHYDEALGEKELQGGKYALRYWQEMPPPMPTP